MQTPTPHLPLLSYTLFIPQGHSFPSDGLTAQTDIQTQ